jgi:hypothetical protein
VGAAFRQGDGAHLREGRLAARGAPG